MISTNIQLMIDIAGQASRFVGRDYIEIEQLQVSKKGTWEFTKRSYNKSEKILIEELTKARPAFGIINPDKQQYNAIDKEYRWVIYPIHGIENFTHALPYFAIVIGIEKLINDQYKTISLVIDIPSFRKVYFFNHGTGGWGDNYSSSARGRTRLRTSVRNEISELIAVTDKVENNTNLAHLRLFGAPLLELCYVSSGKFDLAIYKNTNQFLHSLGSLMMQETGGFCNVKQNNLIFSNNAINDRIINHIIAS